VHHTLKKLVALLSLVLLLNLTEEANAQCSICTKTAQQLGHKPAKGMNTGIIYLMIAPLAIIGFVGYRWWKGGGSDFMHTNES
jgi:hypothetical protein